MKKLTISLLFGFFLISLTQAEENSPKVTTTETPQLVGEVPENCDEIEDAALRQKCKDCTNQSQLLGAKAGTDGVLEVEGAVAPK